MGWQGSSPNQTFVRTDGGSYSGDQLHQNADVGGQGPTAAHFDNVYQDMADALDQCLKKDGGNQPSADLPMNSHKFTGMKQGSARADSLRIDQVQDGDLVYASVGGSANAIELTMSPSSGGPVEGMTVVFVAGSDNTGATTVDLDSNGAVAVQWLGSALVGGEIKSGQAHSITYDGTQWQLNNPSLLGRLASTSNGLGASLIGVEDSAGNFSATDVEAALAEILSRLADTANGEGASLVGIEDSGSLFAATDVEAALAEVMGDVDAIEADYLTSSDILDEDDFASDSASAAPSQQSTKAYVDGLVAPTGSIVMWPTATAPTGWLECDGSAVSRTTYSALFGVIGETYGNGNGSTTFNLPDLRGEFVRGFDNGAGNDPDAASRTDRGDGTTGDNVGTKQADELGSHNHQIYGNDEDNGQDFVVSIGATNADTMGAVNRDANPKYMNTLNGSSQQAIEDTGGNETRPTNVAMMFIIKT